jgi:hypothetical protein
MEEIMPWCGENQGSGRRRPGSVLTSASVFGQRFGVRSVTIFEYAELPAVLNARTRYR